MMRLINLHGPNISNGYNLVAELIEMNNISIVDFSTVFNRICNRDVLIKKSVAI